MPSSSDAQNATAAASASLSASSLPLDGAATSTKHGALLSSWIHNEGQCVTVSHLSLNLGVSRPRACEMLQLHQAEQQRDDAGLLRATRCHVETSTTPTNPCKKGGGADVVPCTVFTLVSGAARAAAGTSDPATALYALSLSTSESVHVAHERDMAHCRDLLASNPRALLVKASLPAGTAIAPSPEMEALWNQSLEGAAAASDIAAPADTSSASASASASAKVVRTKTTASSFFRGGGSSSAATSSSSSKPAAAASATSHATTTKAKSGTGVRSSLSMGKAKSEDEKENKESVSAKRTETNQRPSKPVEGAKSGAKSTSSAAATKTSAKVGNADDFVGDMDTDSDEDDDVVMTNREDDDEEEEEATDDVPVRTQSAAPKAHKSRNMDDNDDDGDVGSGAFREDADQAKPRPMDEFVLSSNAGKSGAAATDSTRRRKRVVERTFKDEHGYLQTELQEVWEDVPVEASQAKSSSSSSSAPAPPGSSMAPIKSAAKKTAMKQGSLMGFFAKK